MSNHKVELLLGLMRATVSDAESKWGSQLGATGYLLDLDPEDAIELLALKLPWEKLISAQVIYEYTPHVEVGIWLVNHMLHDLDSSILDSSILFTRLRETVENTREMDIVRALTRWKLRLLNQKALDRVNAVQPSLSASK
jgi:hypothetical protein